jgi:hypothetical protein
MAEQMAFATALQGSASKATAMEKSKKREEDEHEEFTILVYSMEFLG